MSKVLAITAALIFACTAFAQQATDSNQSAQVQAGGVVGLTVHPDTMPNFNDSAVLVSVAPKHRTPGFPGVQNVGQLTSSKDGYSVYLRIPPTAPAGTWTVTSVRLLVPAGPSVPLKYRTSDFQVVQSENVTVPSSATVEVATSR